MRLIDADVLKEAINEDNIPSRIMAELMCMTIPSNKLQMEILNRACDKHISIIDEQQIVDAVPVVRCEDCRWYYEDFYGCHRCENDGVPRESDWFCADGKRRE